MAREYKKLAGTLAVFILDNYEKSSPVERDGKVWTADELQLSDWPERVNKLPAMASSLALEGLEDYDQPNHGDLREVKSLGVEFVYLKKIKSWVQMS